MHWQDGLLDHLATERLASQAPDLAEVCGGLIESRGNRLGGHPGVDSPHQVMRIEGHQHRAGAERVQRRAGVGQLLPVLAEFVLVGVDPDAPPQGADPDRR